MSFETVFLWKMEEKGIYSYLEIFSLILMLIQWFMKLMGFEWQNYPEGLKRIFSIVSDNVCHYINIYIELIHDLEYTAVFFIDKTMYKDFPVTEFEVVNQTYKRSLKYFKQTCFHYL